MNGQNGKVIRASMETPIGAVDPVQAGRAWAERSAVCLAGFGVRPSAVWKGTVTEAEWLFLASEPRDRRFALALIALEAARSRWRELTASRAAQVRAAA
jgi:hypothetical protein